MYLPWTLAGLARQIPYQFAAAYGVLGVLLIALSFTPQSKQLPLRA
jgi:hypothetical protein